MQQPISRESPAQQRMTSVNLIYHSEEVKRAAYAAPSAIFIAGMCSLALIIAQRVDLEFVIVVIGTGLIGWLLNIVMVLCSGPLYVHLTLNFREHR